MSFAISPHSGQRTPSHGKATDAKPTKHSPINKVDQYFLSERRDRYQKFGYDESFDLPALDGPDFLKLLNFKPRADRFKGLNVHSKGKESFLNLANEVAKSIKDKHFRKHDILEFKNTGNQPPLGHVTETKCKPDITAALKSDWREEGIHWPFIRLAGEKAPEGKTPLEQSVQAKSYLHYLLLARPDLYVAQGLLSSDKELVFLFGIGGHGIQQFTVEWKDPRLIKFLYAFIYRLYDPGHFADPSYINTEFDEKTTAKYTINITYGGSTKECRGFYPIYARNPFATRTHVLSNPIFNVGGKDLTVLKDQFCRVTRHFEELAILNDYVHNPEPVPGVVMAAYGETIKLPRFALSGERCKRRLGLGESGSLFTSIPTLSEVLETLFDVLEVLRYLRLHRNVLHRDISAGNVLYVKNSSNRSLPPNTVSVPTEEEAPANGWPLCYAKILLGKSKNPLETSMLLVDFNLAEHISETDAKPRTGTPLFIARAVELGGPVPSTLAYVPGMSGSPDPYTKAHPDRVEYFPEQMEKLLIDPRKPFADSGSPGEWRHELDHDAESVFWLLFYWAMVVQPESLPEEMINPGPWSNLNGNHWDRQSLIDSLSRVVMPPNVIHSYYNPLQPLIKDLAAVVVIDRRWLPAKDPRRNRFYITEAFQRLILKFMIDNSGKEFMGRRVRNPSVKWMGRRIITQSHVPILRLWTQEAEGVLTWWATHMDL